MQSGYYEAGTNRARRVHDLFTQIAPRYDLINDIQSFWLHRLWKRRLVALANPKPGERALDLCCGSGDIALALVRRRAKVVGLDFTEAMLAVARARASNNSQIQWLLGDVQQIPCADHSFDIVTIGYGLRNLANWDEGIREMLRVAKKGARILLLEFGKPANRLLRALYFSYLKGAVPCFGRVFCGNSRAYSYILDSLEHYPDQIAVAEALRNAGCTFVELVNVLGGTMSIHLAIAP